MGDLRPGGGEVDPESNSECFLMTMMNVYNDDDNDHDEDDDDNSEQDNLLIGYEPGIQPPGVCDPTPLSLQNISPL